MCEDNPRNVKSKANYPEIVHFRQFSFEQYTFLQALMVAFDNRVWNY